MSRHRLAFSQKILFLVGIIATFTFIGAAINFLSNHQLQDRYREMVTKSDYLEITLSNLSDQLHTLDRIDYQLGIHWTEDNQKARDTVLSRIELFMMEIESIEISIMSKDDVANFKKLIEQQKANSSEFMNLLSEQSKSDALDTQAYVNSNQKVILELSRLFALDKNLSAALAKSEFHIKSLLLSRDLTQVDEIISERMKLIQTLEKSRFWDSSSKRKAVKLLEIEMADIKELLNHRNQKAEKLELLKKNLSSVDAFIENLTSKVRAFNEAEIKRLAVLERTATITCVAIVILTLIVVAYASWSIFQMARELSSISISLKANSKQTRQAGHDLKLGAERVSEASIQQAGALQESVATLHQISSMVSKSASYAQTSTEKAEGTFRMAEEGKNSVRDVLKAMEEIRSSMKEMTTHVDTSRMKYEDIVKIIEEIVQKTHIIYDIVFQTKLLSFNAAVEAARAGEHGKGFSVVAEEIGNLAQMSGQAAREINDLLTQSRKSVESIASSSKEELETLVKRGGERVELGAQYALRCQSILDQVVSNVDLVKGLMTEISSAAIEEAEGVKNITETMNHIDRTTQTTAERSVETRESAQSLVLEAEEIEEAVHRLDLVIRGSRAEAHFESPSDKQLRVHHEDEDQAIDTWKKAS